MKLKQTGKLAPVNKPWQLIRDAIDDLKRQERCKSVYVNMSVWHDGGDVACFQCLAGCVMSRRLGIDTAEDVEPNAFCHTVEDRLCALEDVKRAAKGERCDV